MNRDAVRPWPRLLSEGDAADYLSIGSTTLRGLGLKARRVGRRVLYDIRDLDRWVDRMDEQPIAAADHLRESIDEEERFFARRQANGRN
ncbi:hypothetical protein [Sphingomonas sp.]|uniref:hypothetical protein n=1 Tax=Sphingomonas sp. TaxID=28214 RepID=UPI003B0013EC